MAFNNNTPDKAPEKAPEPAKLADDSVLLELALYTNYTYQGMTYTKGKAYRFKKSEAMKLISEMDLGRPLWRLFRPIKPKPVEEVVVDATGITAISQPEPNPGTPQSLRRIDVGTDEEIADILNRPDDGSENVTI